MTVDSPLGTPARHPLARLLREVAAGDFPAADGSWIRVSPWSPSIQGILLVTTFFVLIVGFAADVVQRLVDPRLRSSLSGAHA